MSSFSCIRLQIMRRYLTGLHCCGGAVVYLLFYTLENRGARRLRGASPLSVLRRHWTDRVLAQYKGGVLYAMRKTMWNPVWKSNFGRPTAP